MMSLLSAEDNPFFSTKELEGNDFAPQSNFEKKDFKFNSSARILKNVTITYITLDGSEEDITLDINQSIDWHNNYTISKAQSPNPSPILDVSVTIPEPLLTNEELNSSSLDIELPLDNIMIYDFVSLTSYKKQIKINTKDELLADFTIGNPSKIILDFKNENANMTKDIKLSSPIFKRVVFGSHKEHYRLVIYLDGKYNYTLEKENNGYLLKLI